MNSNSGINILKKKWNHILLWNVEFHTIGILKDFIPFHLPTKHVKEWNSDSEFSESANQTPYGMELDSNSTRNLRILRTKQGLTSLIPSMKAIMPFVSSKIKLVISKKAFQKPLVITYGL